MKCAYCGERFRTERDLDWHRVEVVDNRKYKSNQEWVCLFLGFLQDTKTKWWAIDSLKIGVLTQQRKARLQAVRRQNAKPRRQMGPDVAPEQSWVV